MENFNVAKPRFKLYRHTNTFVLWKEFSRCGLIFQSKIERNYGKKIEMFRNFCMGPDIEA